MQFIILETSVILKPFICMFIICRAWVVFKTAHFENIQMDKNLRTNVTFNIIKFSLYHSDYGSVSLVEKSKVVAKFCGKQTNIIFVAEHDFLSLNISVNSKVSYDIRFSYSSIDSDLIFTDYVLGKSKTGLLDYDWFIYKPQLYILQVSCTQNLSPW